MKRLTNEELVSIIKQSTISSSLKRKLKIATDDVEWRDSNFILIKEKSPTKGVLVYQDNANYYVLRYQLSPLPVSPITGKRSVIICDFCSTWHGSGTSSSVTFDVSAIKDGTSLSFLCCRELACNDNVRNKTNTAHLSRAHLRENISDEERIERFINNLNKLIIPLASPIQLS